MGGAQKKTKKQRTCEGRLRRRQDATMSLMSEFLLYIDQVSMGNPNPNPLTHNKVMIWKQWNRFRMAWANQTSTYILSIGEVVRQRRLFYHLHCRHNIGTATHLRNFAEGAWPYAEAPPGRRQMCPPRRLFAFLAAMHMMNHFLVNIFLRARNPVYLVVCPYC